MKSTTQIRTNHSKFFGVLITGAVIFALSIVALLIFSKSAKADFISFISSLLGSEEASARVELSIPRTNSQTIALLHAAVNPDPNPDKSGGEFPVMDGSLLVADLAASNAILAEEEVNTQISIYVIREGDNLSTIGEMFDVSVNTIMWANGLTKANSIQPGQTLIILPVSGIKYTIQKGDTISGIVSRYKADLNEVLAYNDLSASTPLVAGQTIIIPDGELQAPVGGRTIAGKTVPNYVGYYLRPVKGIKTQGIHGYNGVDLAAPVGTSIYAAAAGVVIANMTGGWNGGYGNYLIISHPNGTQTLYAHNSKNIAQAGQYVEKGDLIATVGSTGKSTGPHLHFEIRGAKNPF
jgi:murein DD-endopeptidase MepM/ murein hydrolase activator NlpD